MPSGIATKSDIEDILYRLGIKDPRAIAAAVRTIDLYSFALARKYLPPAPQVPKLTPGESDTESRVTCCMKCEKVKAWSVFPYSPKSDTKHSDTCKACSSTLRVPRDPFLELECAGCKVVKNADTCFRISASQTGYRAHCKDCESGKVRCEGDCGKIRFPHEYVNDCKLCVFCLAGRFLAGKRLRVKK